VLGADTADAFGLPLPDGCSCLLISGITLLWCEKDEGPAPLLASDQLEFGVVDDKLAEPHFGVLRGAESSQNLLANGQQMSRLERVRQRGSYDLTGAVDGKAAGRHLDERGLLGFDEKLSYEGHRMKELMIFLSCNRQSTSQTTFFILDRQPGGLFRFPTTPCR